MPNTTDPNEIGWWLPEVVVGSKLYFEGEKRPYKIRARSGRFLVCTKPFNAQRTVLYCIVDLVLKVRGPEDLVFGMGAETDKPCASHAQWALNVLTRTNLFPGIPPGATNIGARTQ